MFSETLVLLAFQSKNLEYDIFPDLLPIKINIEFFSKKMYSKSKFSNYKDKEVHNRYIRNTTCESMGHLNMSYPCRIYMSLHHELEF